MISFLYPFHLTDEEMDVVRGWSLAWQMGPCLQTVQTKASACLQNHLTDQRELGVVMTGTQMHMSKRLPLFSGREDALADGPSCPLVFSPSFAYN